MNPVTFARTSRFYMLTGLFALFAFGGDIVADSLADARGDHCVSQSSQSDSDHEKIRARTARAPFITVPSLHRLLQ